jgi:hypothetical protein
LTNFPPSKKIGATNQTIFENAKEFQSQNVNVTSGIKNTIQNKTMGTNINITKVTSTFLKETTATVNKTGIKN